MNQDEQKIYKKEKKSERERESERDYKFYLFVLKS